jgi:hypothetical protein
MNRKPETFGASRHGERGVALILALSVMMVVTLSLILLEDTLNRNKETAEIAAARVQAEYACYGGAVRAAVNPPDGFSMYDYYGTRVRVTVLDPPVSVMQIMMSSNTGAKEGTIRLLQSEAASPTGDASAEAMWYYLVVETEHPEFWTSWPGILRQQPYE